MYDKLTKYGINMAFAVAVFSILIGDKLLLYFSFGVLFYAIVIEKSTIELIRLKMKGTENEEK